MPQFAAYVRHTLFIAFLSLATSHSFGQVDVPGLVSSLKGKTVVPTVTVGRQGRMKTSNIMYAAKTEIYPDGHERFVIPQIPFGDLMADQYTNYPPGLDYVVTDTIVKKDYLELKLSQTLVPAYRGDIKVMLGAGWQTSMTNGDVLKAIQKFMSGVQEVPASPPAPAVTQPPIPADTSTAAPGSATIPAGTQIAVRLVDAFDSKTGTIGKEYRATVDDDVLLNDIIVVPKGTPAYVALVEAKKAGKLEGRAQLTLALARIELTGHPITLKTEEVVSQGSSTGKKSAVVIGSATAVGAVVGGILGKGALGALAGAAVGTAVQAVRPKPGVKLPSETRLTFTLSEAANLP